MEPVTGHWKEKELSRGETDYPQEEKGSLQSRNSRSRIGEKTAIWFN